MYYQNLILSIILFITDQFFQCLAQVEGMSFSIDLIHRDSPQSPFYNRSISSSQLFARDAQRSRARVNRSHQSFSYTHEKVVHIDELLNENNNYVVGFYFGSEKVDRVFGFFDITTDFIWTRCGGPVYDFQKSNTHIVVPDNSVFCQLLPFREAATTVGADCRYQYYVTKMELSTSGFVIEDDFSFDSQSRVRQKKVKFGCADTGLASEDHLGVFGFGKGTLSLPYQTRRRIQHKFSYCLQSPKKSTSSRLKFGALPPWLNEAMVKSPLQIHLSDHSAYYLNLKGISLGGSDLSIGSRHLIKIDLGTPWTYLEDKLFYEVQQMVIDSIATDPIPTLEFGLCYMTEDLGDIQLPGMVFHFDNEIYDEIPSLEFASFHIQSESLFIKNNKKGQTCMSIFLLVGSESESSILGSIAQEGHVMQFDTDKEVSFTSDPINCALF